jgi:hypothetical protein
LQCNVIPGHWPGRSVCQVVAPSLLGHACYDAWLGWGTLSIAGPLDLLYLMLADAWGLMGGMGVRQKRWFKVSRGRISNLNWQGKHKG